MESFHRYLGEGLFVIYVIVIVVVLILGRKDREVPAWLTGAAHGLLALQIAIGVILLISGGLRGIHWLHPVIGGAALLALGLTPTLKTRLRGSFGVVATFAIVAVLVLTAQLIAQLGR